MGSTFLPHTVLHCIYIVAIMFGWPQAIDKSIQVSRKLYEHNGFLIKPCDVPKWHREFLSMLINITLQLGDRSAESELQRDSNGNWH